MTLNTIAREKYETYFVDMVRIARPEEHERRQGWLGSDYVFYLERNGNEDTCHEMASWLTEQRMSHFICQSNVYTFIELPNEADATVFWIRFKT